MRGKREAFLQAADHISEACKARMPAEAEGPAWPAKLAKRSPEGEDTPYSEATKRALLVRSDVVRDPWWAFRHGLAAVDHQTPPRRKKAEPKINKADL